MPYLRTPFDHDIFVTYAHADPEKSGASKLKYWSGQLVKELVGDIQAIRVDFPDLDVFIDEDVDPTLGLTDTLKTNVKTSGLLLLIMSPHYLESLWCRDELRWFENEIQSRAKRRGCVLVVRAIPTLDKDWPACLKDERGHTVLGFWFHPRPAKDITFPFGWPKPLPEDRQFYEELGKVATIVIKRLREIKEHQELEIQVRQPSVRIEIEGSPCIYLQAQREDELAWLAAKKALEEAGSEVKPERLPRVTDDIAAMREARQQRIADLKAAHILLILRASNDSEIERQIEAAASDRADLQAFFNKDLPWAILDYVGGEVAIAEAPSIIDARDGLVGLQVWLADVLGGRVEFDP